MASVIDICNLALGHLGDEATLSSIDPPEGSAQAEHCARFYPLARSALLEMHDWSFATRRVALARLDTASWEWAGAYARPNRAVRILAVLNDRDSSDAESQPYEIGSDEDDNTILLTDAETPSARCTFLVVDTTKYPPLFVEALSRLLASYLAGPMIKGDTGIAVAKAKYQEFVAFLSQAKVSDANQRRGKPTHTPAWISGR